MPREELRILCHIYEHLLFTHLIIHPIYYKHFGKLISQSHFLFYPGCHMSEFCVGVRGVLPHGSVHVSPLSIYNHSVATKVNNLIDNDTTHIVLPQILFIRNI